MKTSKDVAIYVDEQGHCPRCEEKWKSFSDPKHPYLENKRITPWERYCPQCGQKLKHRKEKNNGKETIS